MIDLAALEELASEVDRTVNDEPSPKKRRKSSLKSLREEPPLEDEPSEDEEDEPIIYDPEFEIMITSLVGDVVDKCQESLDWSSPGPHWKQKVGGCIARIVQKRITKGRQIADELVLLGYLALWIGPNVKLPKFGGSEDTSSAGDDGER